MFNIDKDQTLLQMLLIDVDQVRQIKSPTEARENLNLQRVTIVPLHFSPLGSKLGGESTKRKISKGENTDKRYLTEKQAYIQEGRVREFN